MGKHCNQKLNVSKVIILIYFLLAGFFLFSSCKQKQKTNQTSSETQIESINEEQSVTTEKPDSPQKRAFITEDPILFIIIILATILSILTIYYLIKSSYSEVSNTMFWLDQFKKFGRN